VVAIEAASQDESGFLAEAGPEDHHRGDRSAIALTPSGPRAAVPSAAPCRWRDRQQAAQPLFKGGVNGGADDEAHCGS